MVAAAVTVLVARASTTASSKAAAIPSTGIGSPPSR